MKTYIERKLIEMRRIDPILSVDIYYNDGGEPRDEQFVVRCHDHQIDKHFRSNHIRKSLKMALEWLKGQ